MQKVMLVDDEPDILHVVSRGLERFGIEVHPFATSMSALSCFKPHYYDAIILDVGLPEMSGIDLARKIWLLDEDAAICFFSAFEQYENEAPKIFPNKNYCFVKKPIRVEKLALQLQTHLFSKAVVPG